MQVYYKVDPEALTAVWHYLQGRPSSEVAEFIKALGTSVLIDELPKNEDSVPQVEDESEAPVGA